MEPFWEYGTTILAILEACRQDLNLGGPDIICILGVLGEELKRSGSKAHYKGDPDNYGLQDPYVWKFVLSYTTPYYTIPYEKLLYHNRDHNAPYYTTYL